MEENYNLPEMVTITLDRYNNLLSDSISAETLSKNNRTLEIEIEELKRYIFNKTFIGMSELYNTSLVELYKIGFTQNEMELFSKEWEAIKEEELENSKQK